MADVQTNIEAALEAAASETETEESSTSEEVKETVAEEAPKASPESGKSHKGANDRIQELLGESKQLKEQIEELTSHVGSRDEEIGKLVDLLELRDNDAKVVARINELHQTNPELKEIIENLDKAIRNEEFEIPGKEGEGEGEPEVNADVLAKARELIEEAQGRMTDALADSQADLILHKSDVLRDSYLAELPEEYGEDDKRIIQSVLVDHVDWNAIEEDPDSLPDEYAEGFQKALNWYGSPKGYNAAEPEGEESGNTARTEVTQEAVEQFAKQGRL
jgi:hypothetical protein